MPAEPNVENDPLDREGVFEIVRANLADVEATKKLFGEYGTLVRQHGPAAERKQIALTTELADALLLKVDGLLGKGSRAEAEQVLRRVPTGPFEIDPSTIAEGQSFVDDLDADSLALIELVEALEEDLAERSVGFRIEDEDLVDLKTVRDAVDYVYDRVKGN